MSVSNGVDALIGLQTDQTLFRDLLEKRCGELSVEDLDKLIVLRDEFLEWRPRFASRIAQMRHSLKNFDARLAEIEESTVERSSVSLGDALGTIVSMADMIRSLSEEHKTAIALLGSQDLGEGEGSPDDSVESPSDDSLQTSDEDQVSSPEQVEGRPSGFSLFTRSAAHRLGMG
jgi:hypothetical protein